MGGLIPLALMGLARATGWLASTAGVQFVIGAMTFVVAGLVGMQFPLASLAERADSTLTASRLYTADFVGACLGALLASTLLIPLLGVAAVCALAAGLNAAAAAIVLLRKA
jgi:predicted membrane-bound spermidine synthase